MDWDFQGIRISMCRRRVITSVTNHYFFGFVPPAPKELHGPHKFLQVGPFLSFLHILASAHSRGHSV